MHADSARKLLNLLVVAVAKEDKQTRAITVEQPKKSTQRYTEKAANTFNLKFETFPEGLPAHTSYSGSKINVQRMLLMIYKGCKLADISEKLGISYQTVFNCKKNYTGIEFSGKLS